MLYDGGCHLLDGIGHSGEDEHLLVHQGAPLPLPLGHSRRHMITRLFRSIKNDGLRLLGAKVVREICTERLIRFHRKLASGQTEGEDGLHVGVVLDGHVDIVGVLGVILGTKIVTLVVIHMLDKCEQI